MNCGKIPGAESMAALFGLVGLAVLAMAGATPALAQDAPGTAPAHWTQTDRDWGATLKADALAFHAAVLDSHPGPVDPLNPEFGPRLQAGLALALDRAETASDVGGWWWAMRALQAGFDDGHVQLWLTDQAYGFPVRWAGVITVYQGDRQVVASRDETDPFAPPLGAWLVSCDGIQADRLAEARVGHFRGRWGLESQRVNHGHETLLNLSNPWIGDLDQCRFENGDRAYDFAMNWRAITPEDLAARRTGLNPRAQTDFAFRALDDGGFWISMPSFDGTPGGRPHAALTAIIAEAENRQTDLRTAPYVVLDLRGNGGGSSHWGNRLSNILWGETWQVAHRLPQIEGVDWRASEANIAVIREFHDALVESGGDGDLIAWAAGALNGMTQARAAGLEYWRQDNPPRPGLAADVTPTNPMRGRVYVLTDSACGSACLDAVDIWKATGAIQVGRETSADTVYMEIRDQALPSGLAGLALPMKVYRGRARGNNQPHRPDHVFEGDMRDEAAIRAWLSALPVR